MAPIDRPLESILATMRGLSITAPGSPVYVSLANAKAICEAWKKREAEVERLTRELRDAQLLAEERAESNVKVTEAWGNAVEDLAKEKEQVERLGIQVRDLTEALENVMDVLGMKVAHLHCVRQDAESVVNPLRQEALRLKAIRTLCDNIGNPSAATERVRAFEEICKILARDMVAPAEGESPR